MILVLIGPPGAGKGTQCKRLVDRYGLKHLSSGDIFRSEIAAQTEVGITAKRFIDDGKLVPDPVVIEMMTKAVIEAGDCILDGFPRTVNQAKSLDEALNEGGCSIKAVVVLEIDDAIVAGRLSERRVCLECGATFHLQYSKPAADGVCDACGSKLIHRDDDKAEVINNRLTTYHQQTSPIVEYYDVSGKTVITVDADRNIDEITEELISKIDNI